MRHRPEPARTRHDNNPYTVGTVVVGGGFWRACQGWQGALPRCRHGALAGPTFLTSDLETRPCP